MGDGYIAQQIRRCNRNSLLFAGITLLVLVLATAASWRYLYNFFRGPFSTDPFQLLTVSDPDTLKQYFVTIPAGEPLDTGGAEEENGVAKARFVAVVVGHRFLLVKVPADSQAKQISGELTTIPGEVRSKIVAPTEASQAGLQGSFLPFMLDASDGFRTPGYVGLGLGLLFAVIAVLVLRSSYSSDPTNHPILLRLQKLGPGLELAANIDQEMNSGQALKFGLSAMLTPSWLLSPGTFSLKLLRLQDLVWFYKKVTTHRVNFVPVGKTYSVMLWDRYKTVSLVEMGRKEELGNSLLQELVRRAPWALAGYSADLQKLWQKDFRGVVAAVDERRARPKTPCPGPS
ncbi:MAG TPA: DUF6709 family protein [Terriglobales bacterium]|jgi:hypothetical protein|nr:DUF6709 family protein [Terriglobales bacterium]